jgi:hypothetical protein
MDVDRVADRPVRRACIHQIDVNVNELAPVIRQHGGAEQSIRLSVNDNLYEPGGLADFDGFAAVPHFEPSGFDRSAGLSRIALGHADAAELRIGEGRVWYDPLCRPRAITDEL